ncbi:MULTISPECIES: universal stress protein [Nocardiaceae]|jgi:nucleotide-binding universal stress UspA family protein|uniref:universal stress protein n=1 Tax=Nocardiaceae TaxID=85025 RepID=UPI00050C067B|nr:universal stress protein [Rhodococcus fascians]MDJ0468246.1 universal stress protein [Rhodococcus fascians]
MNTSHSTGPVTVGIDGSETALDAVRFAVQEARGRGTSLRLVHVIDRHAMPETVYGAPDIDADYAQSALSRAVDVAAAADSTVAVESVVLQGRPESVMSTEAGSASLLVLGTTTGNAVAAWVLGSMVGAVVEASPHPVAIVRHFDARGHGPVVAALGDIEVSATDVVVNQAFREASMREASVLAVHIQSVASILTAALSGPADGLHPESAMDVRLEPFGDDYPDIRVASVYAEADSESELVAMSETAQLMVVGHERDRVPGRTLTALLRHAHCPVLVVPHA